MTPPLDSSPTGQPSPGPAGEAAPTPPAKPLAPEAAPSTPPTFWQRRMVAPLRAQLVQGITPEKLALTVALGLVLGCFPILGAATALCTAAGFTLRLNQPVIHAVNQAAYPLQLTLLIPHYRAGEWLFQTSPVPLSITMLYDRFTADWRQFLHDYGLLALQGVAVWCLLAPVVAATLYFATRNPLRHLARAMAR